MSISSLVCDTVLVEQNDLLSDVSPLPSVLVIEQCASRITTSQQVFSFNKEILQLPLMISESTDEYYRLILLLSNCAFSSY